jgi:predicted transcriptional regulator
LLSAAGIYRRKSSEREDERVDKRILGLMKYRQALGVSRAWLAEESTVHLNTIVRLETDPSASCTLRTYDRLLHALRRIEEERAMAVRLVRGQEIQAHGE